MHESSKHDAYSCGGLKGPEKGVSGMAGRWVRPLCKQLLWMTCMLSEAAMVGGRNTCDILGVQTLEGNAWHADHVIPVYKGGGMCQLDNLRTLCVPCHQVSAASAFACHHNVVLNV